MKPRQGRPRVDPTDVSVDVHFRLAAKQYDLSEKRANQARMALADWFRQAIVKACREPPAKV